MSREFQESRYLASALQRGDTQRVVSELNQVLCEPRALDIIRNANRMAGEDANKIDVSRDGRVFVRDNYYGTRQHVGYLREQPYDSFGYERRDYDRYARPYESRRPYEDQYARGYDDYRRPYVDPRYARGYEDPSRYMRPWDYAQNQRPWDRYGYDNGYGYDSGYGRNYAPHMPMSMGLNIAAMMGGNDYGYRPYYGGYPRYGGWHNHHGNGGLGAGIAIAGIAGLFGALASGGRRSYW